MIDMGSVIRFVLLVVSIGIILFGLAEAWRNLD